MFPSAFTRGNSVAFSFGEARRCMADGAPVARSLKCQPCTHTDRLTHLSSWAPSSGSLIAFFHLDVILNIHCHHGKIQHLTVLTSHSLHLWFCASLIFTAGSLLRPSCLKAEGVRAVFCGDRENHQRAARYRTATNSTLWHNKATKWGHIDTV